MKNKLKKIFKIILIGLLGVTLGHLCVGFFKTKPDKIIENNSEYILVIEYKWNNQDSVVYKYPAPKIYPGIVISTEKNSNYVGVPGKGGHRDTHYYVNVKANNQVFQVEDYGLYYKYRKGDKVKVKETWYPAHRIIVY